MNLSISTYCPTATNTVPIGVDFLFTFTGKERDEETGYTYHGARYYDASLMCSWFSVDPLSDKYPSVTPYNYCMWNPIKLVDLDGREVGDYYSIKGKHLGTDGKNDGKLFIAFGNEEKIKKQIENNDFSFDYQYICTKDALAQIYNYVEEKCNGSREYGGSIFQDETGNQKVFYSKPGPEFSYGDSYASIQQCNWSEDYNFNGLSLVLHFHTHFRGLVQHPSQDDRDNILNENGERVGGASCPFNIMVAMASRKFFFYNENKLPAAEWSFSTVKKIIGGN